MAETNGNAGKQYRAICKELRQQLFDVEDAAERAEARHADSPDYIAEQCDCLIRLLLVAKEAIQNLQEDCLGR